MSADLPYKGHIVCKYSEYNNVEQFRKVKKTQEYIFLD
jgi:hypothetical protein